MKGGDYIMIRYDVDIHFSHGWDTYSVNANGYDNARAKALIRVLNECGEEMARQIDDIRVYAYGTDKLIAEYSI